MTEPKHARELLEALQILLGENDYDANGLCKGCWRERENDELIHCAIQDDKEDCPRAFARGVPARAKGRAP